MTVAIIRGFVLVHQWQQQLTARRECHHHHDVLYDEPLKGWLVPVVAAAATPAMLALIGQWLLAQTSWHWLSDRRPRHHRRTHRQP